MLCVKNMNEVELISIGVTPEAAVSGAILTQTEYSTFLTFNAMKKDDEGVFKDAGTALIEFEGCLITKFGHPNDEPQEGHPLYREVEKAGGCYDAYEVKKSSWLKEVEEQNDVTFPGINYNTRHFIIFFHDSTFECLANDMKARAKSALGTSLNLAIKGYKR